MEVVTDSALTPSGDPASAALRISHVAALVPDIDCSIRFLCELLGWGPWSVYQLVEPRLNSQRYRGSDGVFGIAISFVLNLLKATG